jgi:hypothetical protein
VATIPAASLSPSPSTQRSLALDDSMLSSPRPSRLARLRWWISIFIVAIAFTILAVRQQRFISRYAVNVMFFDQWSFYSVLFKGGGWWATFDYQHAPHRQGVGFLLTRVIANASHWNSRADAFGVGFVLIAAAVFAIPLAWLCGAREPLTWLAIPLLYFNLRQYESLIGTPNISHGAMPILLFTLYCLALFVPRTSVRLALVSVLTFGMMFTGFGIFIGLVTPMILAIEFFQALLSRKTTHSLLVLAALIVNGLSWLAFAHGYDFALATGGVPFPWIRPVEYFYFVGAMFANSYGVFGTTPPIIAFGLFVAACLVSLCLYHAWRMIRFGVEHQPRSAVIFSLTAYSLIYVANTAIGRINLDWRQQALGSRYVTLLIAASLAIFLQLSTLKPPRLAAIVGILYALCVAPNAFFLNKTDWGFIHWFHDGKVNWKNAYLTTHDEETANRISEFRVYPTPGAITDELNYLEEHHLNLFYRPEPK